MKLTGPLEQDDQQDDEKDQATNTDIHERSPYAPLPMLQKPMGWTAGSSAHRLLDGKSGHLCWASDVRVGVCSPLRPWITHMLRSTAGT